MMKTRKTGYNFEIVQPEGIKDPLPDIVNMAMLYLKTHSKEDLESRFQVLLTGWGMKAGYNVEFNGMDCKLTYLPLT